MGDYNYFRIEMRKRLGRIYFYPQNIDVYVTEIIQLVKNNEEYFERYAKNFTSNEKKVFLIIKKYLKKEKIYKDISQLLDEKLSEE